MKYKPDWENTKRRYEAWWHGEPTAKAYVQIFAPKQNRIPRPKAPLDMRERFTNIDYIFESTLNYFENTYFLGEAFPCFWPNLGPDFLAALAGCELEFGDGTSWSIPFAKSLDEVDFKFDEKNPYWKIMAELSEEVAKNAPGQYVYGVTDLHPSLDVLAAVRGGENLCLDMIEEPQSVQSALQRATGLFETAFEKLYNIGKKYQPDGSTTTLQVWSPDKYFINCCDFIYMISTPMFDSFAKPVVSRELEFLDSSIFHVDGIGSLNHLDSILTLDKLKAVQWVYGDGQPSAKHWISVFKKIQQAGKLVYTYGPPEDLPEILKEVDKSRFLYCTWCDSKGEAEDLLRIT